MGGLGVCVFCVGCVVVCLGCWWCGGGLMWVLGWYLWWVGGGVLWGVWLCLLCNCGGERGWVWRCKGSGVWVGWGGLVFLWGGVCEECCDVVGWDVGGGCGGGGVVGVGGCWLVWLGGVGGLVCLVVWCCWFCVCVSGGVSGLVVVFLCVRGVCGWCWGVYGIDCGGGGVGWGGCGGCGWVGGVVVVVWWVVVCVLGCGGSGGWGGLWGWVVVGFVRGGLVGGVGLRVGVVGVGVVGSVWVLGGGGGVVLVWEFRVGVLGGYYWEWWGLVWCVWGGYVVGVEVGGGGVCGDGWWVCGGGGLGWGCLDFFVGGGWGWGGVGGLGLGWLLGVCFIVRVWYGWFVVVWGVWGGGGWWIWLVMVLWGGVVGGWGIWWEVDSGVVWLGVWFGLIRMRVVGGGRLFLVFGVLVCLFVWVFGFVVVCGCLVWYGFVGLVGWCLYVCLGDFGVVVGFWGCGVFVMCFVGLGGMWLWDVIRVVGGGGWEFWLVVVVWKVGGWGGWVGVGIEGGVFVLRVVGLGMVVGWGNLELGYEGLVWGVGVGWCMDLEGIGFFGLVGWVMRKGIGWGGGVLGFFGEGGCWMGVGIYGWGGVWGIRGWIGWGGGGGVVVGCLGDGWVVRGEVVGGGSMGGWWVGVGSYGWMGGWWWSMEGWVGGWGV
uniref:Uncharacterized protein n=1 Tax=Knipowitschia caucasica TaxID=637954 RepID=A0AAV2LTI9_KNICA